MSKQTLGRFAALGTNIVHKIQLHGNSLRPMEQLSLGVGENDFATLHFITQFYLESDRFSGCSLSEACALLGSPEEVLRDTIRRLIESESILLIFGDLQPNPSIRAVATDDPQLQLQKLASCDFEQTFAFPSFQTLQHAVSPEDYEGRPFTLRLALGEPQLSFETFELAVLEHYRNSDRYHYSCSDIVGTVWEQDSEAANGSPGASLYARRPLIRSFGFAHNEAGDRAIAVFLCYLARLSPEQQQTWQKHLSEGSYVLNPDFYRVQIAGEWPERLSIFDALIEEMRQINTICHMMGRYTLFDRVPASSEKPENFSFLVRPTQCEYRRFLDTLDGLLSENISLEFFGSDLRYLIGNQDLQQRDAAPEGEAKEVSQSKIEGDPLAILERWLLACFRTPDQEPLKEIARAIRQVRIARFQARSGTDDKQFDLNLLRKQRAMVKRVYNALRALRTIFDSHPTASKHCVPKQLAEGLIWVH